MTEYKEPARLRPNWQDDEIAGRAVSVLRSINPDLADKLNAAIVANNALKSEAASAIEALEAERDEARELAYDQPHGPTSRVLWSTRYSEVLSDAKDAYARCKRLEEALSRLLEWVDPYATPGSERHEADIELARQALQPTP